jgi:hypothetical protein
MSRYRTVYTEVEVDVDLKDFTEEELVEELESRGKMIGDNRVSPKGDSVELLTAIYEKRRAGEDYQPELNDLIYNVLGRIV